MKLPLDRIIIIGITILGMIGAYFAFPIISPAFYAGRKYTQEGFLPRSPHVIPSRDPALPPITPTLLIDDSDLLQKNFRLETWKKDETTGRYLTEMIPPEAMRSADLQAVEYDVKGNKLGNATLLLPVLHANIPVTIHLQPVSPKAHKISLKYLQ